MPLTKKGKKIKKNMEKEYGKEKGEKVFYASANKGTIKGVHGEDIEKYATPEEKEFLKEYNSNLEMTPYQRGYKAGYDQGWKDRDERRVNKWGK
jgi:hypothetical protein